MNKYWRWIGILIFLYSATAVRSVSAHALLVRSTPAANEVLSQPAVQVEIFFSEPLEAKLSSIRVFNSDNLSVDAGDVRVDPADPTRLTVSLHSLVDGVYTVTWKVVSATDGHQTVGTFPFAVGDVNAEVVNNIRGTTSFRLPFSTLFSKFLMLASLALLVAHRLFSELVWRPAVQVNADNVVQPPVWSRLYELGLIGFLLSIGLGILAQGGQTSGSELSGPWNPELGRMLTETRLGVIWLARLALAILAVWLAGRPDSALRDWGSFAVSLILLFSVTLTSHAATEARPLLPILADWAHLLGMAFWLGGLVYLFTALRHLRSLDGGLLTKLSSSLARHFSITAILFVGLTGLTGLYSAYLRVGSWSGLISTLYGHTLLVKQALVAGLLVIAATNLLVISPQLKRDRLQGIVNAPLLARFTKHIRFELMLAGLLLASVSFLTYIPPARIAAQTAELNDSAEVDDLRLNLSISPGRIGQNTYTLIVVTTSGHPLHTAREVLLRFTLTASNLAPSELELIGQGNGTFIAKGTNLSLPGVWRVQAIVRREDKFDTYADFNFALEKPGAGNESAATIARLTGSLVLLAGFLCGMLAFTVNANPTLHLGAGAPLSLLAILLGFFLLSRPAPVRTEPENPIPLSPESIAAGQALFLTQCAPCHGETGKGDGPVGLTLNPRPADLTQHAIPGVHTDAQLFEWITNGFPGSQMPAFKSTLSDTDRWYLVNFIRSLAPK